MKIARLKVEGGFFDGLNIAFSDGLNVIIGGRGVGKTSVLELIRFCLGPDSESGSIPDASLEHAINVLGGGEVTVELVNGNVSTTVSRTASDRTPRASSESYPRATILSQREIERLPSLASGRQTLLDAFMPSGVDFSVEPREVTAQIRSSSVEIAKLEAEISQLEERLRQLSKMELDLRALEDKQKGLRTQSKSLAELQTKLAELQTNLNAKAVVEDTIRFTRERLSEWESSLSIMEQEFPELPEWPPDSGDDRLAPLYSRVEGILKKYHSVIEEIGNVVAELRALEQSAQAERVPLDAEARTLRQKVEVDKEGAGKLERALSELREAIARLAATKPVVQSKKQRLETFVRQRAKSLNELAHFRSDRYQSRLNVAKRLNKALGPAIEVTVLPLSVVEAYEAALVETLQGTGLHFKSVAPVIARTISPGELAELVVTGDHAGFASALDIAEERAARILSGLRERGLGAVLTASVDDDVELRLLDGSDHKSTDTLSIGQRCTVVLSIVLENAARALLIDEPESHLDNEFIVDTLIRALRQRSESAQTIVASHNANVPVLGDAARVFLLDSNGSRGFVKVSGTLEDPEIVRSISDVMEGGSEAFEKRAKFYGKRPG